MKRTTLIAALIAAFLFSALFITSAQTTITPECPDTVGVVFISNNVANVGYSFTVSDCRVVTSNPAYGTEVIHPTLPPAPTATIDPDPLTRLCPAFRTVPIVNGFEAWERVGEPRLKSDGVVRCDYVKVNEAVGPAN